MIFASFGLKINFNDFRNNPPNNTSGISIQFIYEINAAQ